jgi:tetratricopeptide (TPR) repeat protein
MILTNPLLKIRHLIFLILMPAGIITCLSHCVPMSVTMPEVREDERMEQLNNSARAAFRQGAVSQAEKLYERVLKRAYIRDDLPAIVDAKYNLGVCRLRLRLYESALATALSAERDAVGIGDRPLADILLMKSQILYRMGKEEDAWHISEKLIKKIRVIPQETSAMIHALRGRIACKRGDTHSAREELGAMGEVNVDQLLAERSELIGCIQFQEGAFQTAARAFDEAVSFHRKALHYALMAEALARAGAAYEQSGEPGTAANRFLRAGRSAQLQEMAEEAIRWLTIAFTLASNAGKHEIAEEADRRLSEVSATNARH